jgi:preprotein translocase subunit YajC
MSQGNGLGALLLPVLLLLLVGFMFWSQRRRARVIQDIQASLNVGDEVCTTSGLFGRITAMDELVATLEISPGTTVRFDRRAIATKVEGSAGGGTAPGPTTSPDDGK